MKFFIILLAVHAVGATGKDPRPTIVNGEVTMPSNEVGKRFLLSSVRIGQVPLQQNGEYDFSRFKGGCSGTLIANRQVATAAHCFSSPPSSWVYFIEVRESLIPDKRKYIRIESVSTERDITETMKIMDDDHHKRSLDLASLTLSEEVSDEHIAPLCENNPVINNDFIVTGFGATEDASADKSSLRHASVKMQSVNPGTLFSQPIKDQPNNATACFGDSGGGLYKVDHAKDRACFAGVVSGNDLKRKISPNTPPAEICGQPDIRQIFARATPQRLSRLETTISFPAYPQPGEVEESPGSPGIGELPKPPGRPPGLR